MDDKVKRQFARLGVPAHQVAAAARSQTCRERHTVKVAAHLWPAVHLFKAMQTQWVVVPIPGVGLYWVGLNNAAIAPTMDLLGLQRNPNNRLLGYLQIMELEAKAVLNTAQTS